MGIFGYGALGAVLGVLLVACQTIFVVPVEHLAPMDGFVCLVIGTVGGLPVGMMVGALVQLLRRNTRSETGIFAYSVLGAGLGVFVAIQTSFLGPSDQAESIDGFLYLIVGVCGGSIVGMLVGAAVLVHRQKSPAAVEAEKFRLTSASNWRVNTLLAGDAICPRGGNWTAYLASGHPGKQAFERCHRTFRVEYGSRFPDPAGIMAGVEVMEVRWQWALPTDMPSPRSST